MRNQQMIVVSSSEHKHHTSHTSQLSHTSHTIQASTHQHVFATESYEHWDKDMVYTFRHVTWSMIVVCHTLDLIKAKSLTANDSFVSFASTCDSPKHLISDRATSVLFSGTVDKSHFCRCYLSASQTTKVSFWLAQLFLFMQSKLHTSWCIDRFPRQIR